MDNTKLIISFPDKVTRKDFIGQLDSITLPTMDEPFYSIGATCELPEDSLGEMSVGDLFNYVFNKVPPGKTFKEVHGWG